MGSGVINIDFRWSGIIGWLAESIAVGNYPNPVAYVRNPLWQLLEVRWMVAGWDSGGIVCE